ncbi:MAG: hypothetical protein ACFCU1_07875 [Sumerlaeia bacterium]
MKVGFRDQVEITIILAVVVILLPLGYFLPKGLPLGEVILYSAALLLFQGLVRDLAVKVYPPKSCEVVQIPQTDQHGNRSTIKTCMCAESTIGIVGVVSGVLLLFSGWKLVLQFPWYSWPLGGAAVLLGGFFLKSIVIDWKNKRLMRVQDHRTIKR